MASTIRPLPGEAVAQITSSSKINSLKDAIIGLLRNALDAKASKIDITADYRRGGCTVEDDGDGIPPNEFHETGGLGKKHHTSKYESSGPVYGWQGVFLWSLASLSLLTITSHHHLHRSHNSLTMHRSSVIARSTPSLAHQRVSFQSHGTRVTVRDLFGNLPVRRKSQYLAAINNGDRSKEWEALKKAIVGLLLAWGLEVEVVVRDVEHDRKMVFRCPNHFQPVKNRSDTRSSTSATLISLTQSLFIQASYLPVQSRKSWVSISGSNSSLSINGAISLEPTPTKQFQFMSLGIEPSFADAGNNVLFDEVNRLFSASTFGIVGDDGYEIDERPQEKHPKDPSHRNENYTRMQLKLQKKGVDRWPMFFLKINIGPRAHHNMEGDSSFVKDGDMKAILELLQILVQRFLEEYSFIARTQKPCTVIKPNETPQDSRPSVQFSTPSALRNDNSSPQGGERANLVPEGLQDRLLPLRRRHSNIRLRPRLQTDDLGGGVKLPRLENNRLLDPDIDFGTRSRMKSARSGPYGYTGGMSYEALKRKEQSSESEGNAFPPVPNSSSRRRPRCGEDPGREGSKPTLPDDDWNARMSSGASLSMVQKAYPEKQDDVAAPDTEIHWLNPHTKTPFCFNARIGFIVPPTSSRHHACPLSCGRVRLGGDDVNISINDTSRPSTTAKEHDNELRSCDWIKGVLTEWKNPVFPPTEERIPRLLTGAIEPGHVLSKDGKSCSFPANEKLGEICGPVLPRRISREALRQAKIIAQVDKKFILARLDIEQVNQGSENVISSRQILILVDQHAADERCRVESLLCELCTPSTHEIDTSRSNLGLRSSVNTIMLDKPLKFQISDLEYPLYQVYAAHFARWGILYDLPSMGRRLGDRSETTNLISVKTIPPGVAERCRIEPQLLARLLREEIWHQKELGSSGKDRSGSNMDCSLLASHLAPTHDSEPVVNGHRWSRELSNCPRLLLDMLNSRACRSAIMFGDELSLDECQALVTRLADCAFPFQCAHGRLSMVPLVDFNHSAGWLDDSSTASYGSSSAFEICGKPTFEASNAGESFIERFRAWQNVEREEKDM